MANKLLVGLVFLLCCNDDNATSDASPPLSLEIGTEDNGYQPIPQQGTIEAYMGAAGRVPRVPGAGRDRRRRCHGGRGAVISCLRS